MMSPTTMLVLVLGTVFIPPIIELLGPVAGEKESIRKAKRQIASILSNALGVLTAMLEGSGVELTDDFAMTFIISAAVAKFGSQAIHDGYWTDKNVPQLRAQASQ